MYCIVKSLNRAQKCDRKLLESQVGIHSCMYVSVLCLRPFLVRVFLRRTGMCCARQHVTSNLPAVVVERRCLWWYFSFTHFYFMVSTSFWPQLCYRLQYSFTYFSPLCTFKIFFSPQPRYTWTSSPFQSHSYYSQLYDSIVSVSNS